MQTLKDMINCDKRVGPEGSLCSNCWTNHTFTEELLHLKVSEWIKRKQKFTRQGEYLEKYYPRLDTNYEQLVKEGKIEKFEDHASLRLLTPETIAWIKHFFNITEDELLDEPKIRSFDIGAGSPTVGKVFKRMS